MAFPDGSDGKETSCNAGDLGLTMVEKDPMEKGMATHSSILACRILWTRGTWHATVDGVTRVRHDWSDLAAAAAHARKVMLKILQARLQQYMNCEIPDVQAGFRKGRGTGDQTANISQS